MRPPARHSRLQSFRRFCPVEGQPAVGTIARPARQSRQAGVRRTPSGHTRFVGNADLGVAAHGSVGRAQLRIARSNAAVVLRRGPPGAAPVAAARSVRFKAVSGPGSRLEIDRSQLSAQSGGRARYRLRRSTEALRLLEGGGRPALVQHAAVQRLGLRPQYREGARVARIEVAAQVGEATRVTQACRPSVASVEGRARAAQEGHGPSTCWRLVGEKRHVMPKADLRR